jgi:hypothetical protein
MNVELSTEEVWQTIDKELFAVVGMVNAANEARTAGLVYIVRDRKLYLATGATRGRPATSPPTPTSPSPSPSPGACPSCPG